jgi:hypothetical protein
MPSTRIAAVNLSLRLDVYLFHKSTRGATPVSVPATTGGSVAGGGVVFVPTIVTGGASGVTGVGGAELGRGSEELGG